LSNLILSATVQQLPLGRLESVFQALEAAGVAELHFEIGDGRFAPFFGLDPAFIRLAKATCGLACHAHLMVQDPERHIDAFAAAGCDIITIHVEACRHQHRALQQIRAAGATPGIALKATTPLTTLDYLLAESGRVLLLTRDLGEDDVKPLKSAYERARILQEIIRYHKYSTSVEAKGGIDVREAATFVRMGVDRVVLEGDVLFPTPEADLTETIATFRSDAEVAEHLV